MTRVLYALEAVFAIWITAAVGGIGLWVYRLCVAVPLWVPVVAMGVGFISRLFRQWSLVGWVLGWHGVIARRVEER